MQADPPWEAASDWAELFFFFKQFKSDSFIEESSASFNRKTNDFYIVY